jgi:putative ABC transport system substrate-binding protein
MATIGFLDSASPVSRGDELDAFFNGLANAGVPRKNAMVLYAWADNDYSLLPDLAKLLIKSNVDVIVAAGGPVSALAAQRETTTIPIIFTTVTDPVGSGLVRSREAPGGNLTGTWGHTTELDGPRLRALCELTGHGKIGVLANPNRPFPKAANADGQKGGLEKQATDCETQAIVVNAGSGSDIEGAFKTFKGQIAGLLVTADPFFNSHRKRVIELAEKLEVPAIYQWSGFVDAGGLMSYGPSKEEGYRNAGELAGDIITKGAKPANLPVRDTDKFSLVINDKTAAKLNLNTQGAPFKKMIQDLKVDDIRHI